LTLTDASWIRTAIGELRHIPDTKDLREDLCRELRQLQEVAQDEFAFLRRPSIWATCKPDTTFEERPRRGPVVADKHMTESNELSVV
jgi:hypothetical protein